MRKGQGSPGRGRREGRLPGVGIQTEASDVGGEGHKEGKETLNR